MKKVLAVVLGLLLSTAATSANTFTIGGGMNLLNQSEVEGGVALKGSGMGLYLNGSANFSQIPLAVTASYNGSSTNKLRVVGGGTTVELDVDNSVSLFKVLTGYQLPTVPVAIGGGWVVQGNNFDDYSGPGKDLRATNSGLALAAFGSYSFSEKISASAQLYYVPAATLRVEVGGKSGSHWDTSGSGIEISGIYRIKSNIAVEVGYVASKLVVKDPSIDAAFKAGGLFFGAKYTF